jgi:uncharacterized protein YecE (DUF72 family)
MQWSAGTSGFSYKAWKGPFYPADLADGDMLGAVFQLPRRWRNASWL